MKKLTALLCLAAALIGLALPARADGGSVTYSGDAGKCIFAPGSEYSPTDLFPNFKDVMPGDTLSQPITVKNDASDKVKIKIYLRALGAHPDSEDFLSQLQLTVEKSGEQACLFDAAAHETAQLTDWVCLGTLYSGGTVDLNVTLHVPVELDNAFQQQIGLLDWEFMIEEFPVEPSDPVPETGDRADLRLWLLLLTASLCLAGGAALLLRRKKG